MRKRKNVNLNGLFVHIDSRIFKRSLNTYTSFLMKENALDEARDLFNKLSAIRKEND